MKLILNKNLARYLQPLTEEELIYKEYYELKQKNAPLEEFFESIANRNDIRKDLFIKELEGSGYYEKVTDIFYPFDYDIVAARHTRYHPLFLHRHPFYEIVYQIEGTCTNTINNITVEMTEGDICIIPPGPVHTVGVFDNSIIVNILVKPESITNSLHELLARNNIITKFFEGNEFTYSYNYALFRVTNDIELKDIMESLILECFNKDIHTLPMRKTLLMLAFNHLLRYQLNNMELSENKNKLHTKVQSICQYLKTSYQTTNLNDTARQFNYSPTYLCKLIRNSTGHTFNDILTRIRITKACDLLATTKKGINDIAELVGYESPEYFNKVFKKYMGVSATEYRKDYNMSVIKNMQATNTG
jgi:AraC-like DNA-binding protein/mannose-6-phosphate isomerase-like protein (cupin superfamily)